MATLKLFDRDRGSSDDENSKIEIDHEFAKRYEYNKRREELQKYESLKKKGLINSSESDSGESSSDGEEPSKEIDAEFFDALIKVKNQDPILRQKDAKLFDSDDDEVEDEDGDTSKKQKKEKPMYLKDVVSKHLIEGGPEFSDEGMESEDDDGVKNRIKSYAEEQAEMRQGFLKALEDGENEDDGGDFLRVKSSGHDEDDDDDDDVIGGKLDEYFGEDEKLDEDTMFLKDYFRNRMWDDDVKRKDDAGGVDTEDEDEIEKQEDYEREYNFRFEENAGDRVMGHSRKVEGSVRKKDNARKSQRERKEERMAQAELERREELKRLKNLKKKEINDKLEKIREVAGIGKDKEIFDKDDLEEEFDPEAHDKKMKEAFGEGYYEEEDVDPEFGSDGDGDEDGLGLDKPDFNKEDEFLGLEKGWDEVDESGQGFRSARERVMKDKVPIGDEKLLSEDVDDEPKEGKRKRKRKPSDVEKAVMEELLDEYYKLDYEDTIGDLKTRFKYKPVKAKRYGLSAEEVLMMEDKELNQYVSLKKLAPYREKEWEVPRIKTLQLKKSKQYLKGGNDDDRIRKGRHQHHKDKGVESEEASQPVESKESISRKRKRKQNQAELKLSQSRLMAYGKIPSKSKSKNE